MLRQLNNLSKFTTSSIKYAATNTAALMGLSASSKEDPSLPSIQLLTYWITEAQRGLDAFFNDEFELAHSIFMQHIEESPFHAVGYALIAYVEAMLCFETEKLQIALERITAADVLAKKIIKKARRRSWYGHKSPNPPQPMDDAASQDYISSISFDDANLDSTPKKKKSRSTEIYYELIILDCTLMASTIQFLRNNWIEYMKATYRLRKAYKHYEQLFESITGKKTSEYASDLKHKSSSRSSVGRKKAMLSVEQQQSLTSVITNSPVVKASWTEKRSSFNPFPNKRLNLEVFTSKKRPMSTLETETVSVDSTFDILENTIESGVFFGIGLFSLIFSLLPPKVNKILNTLGFQSSRPFALHLLQKSFKCQGLYSCLSALSLLVYYTNLSMFIHPKLLPNSLGLDHVRDILDQMKVVFPQGKMWKLLEGKLCKMEGKTRKGVEILRDARRRKNIRIHVGLVSANQTIKPSELGEIAQLQALAVYEMGWGQIFLGDFFQAAETFFRLESMNNWSRAFYHYIATCCMFADEEYEKAALEYMQIPNMLKRKKQSCGRLLPNEVFVERKIRHWKNKQLGLGQTTGFTGHILKTVVVVNPLWELIYLWNGFSQLTVHTLQHMKQSIEGRLLNKKDIGIDLAQLYLLLGVSVRELGDYDLAEKYLKETLQFEDDPLLEDQWVIPHSLYELAALCCFRLIKCIEGPEKKKLYQEAQDWILKSERALHNRINHNHYQQNNHTNLSQDSLNSDDTGDSDWDSRLHVRCQLLIEKLEDFKSM